MQYAVLPIFLFLVCAMALAVGLLIVAGMFNPGRPGRVKRMPYESGMDPIHDTRRRFDVRFHLLAIAFLVFDVELLFLVPWAVAFRPAEEKVESAVGAGAGFESTESYAHPSSFIPHPSSFLGIDAAVRDGLVESRNLVFAGAMIFLALLTLGFVYDWRVGVFRWR
jgi:NADH-quinone oxidoreductase subunit A